MTSITQGAAPSRTTDTPAPMSFGRRLLWLGPTGIIVAGVLSVGEWIVVMSPGNHGTPLVALAALLMTLPVVLARRWPMAAVIIVTVAAVLNGLLFPDVVRCAGAFPAVLYIAFAVGAHSRAGGRSWAWPVLGLLIVLADLVAQFVWDSALNADTGFLGFGPPIALAVWAAGIGWSVLRERRARQTTVIAER